MQVETQGGMMGVLRRLRRRLFPPPPPPRQITLRYATSCATCGKALPEGVPAWWAKGHGCFCPTCWDKG